MKHSLSGHERDRAIELIRTAMIEASGHDSWTPGLIAAFDSLAQDGLPAGVARAFRQALDLPDPAARAACALATYAVICRHFGFEDNEAERGQRAARLKRDAANG